MDRDAARQVAVAAGILGLVVLGLTSDYGSSGESGSLIIPADYAFSIWAPIYLGGLVFAAYQARRSVRTDPILRRVGWPIALAYFTAGIWDRVFDRAPYLLSQALVVVTVLAAGAALAGLGPATPGVRAAETWLVRAPIALFAGWITLATAAATTELLLARDVGGLGLGAVPWAVLVLLVAGAIAVAVTLRHRASFAYPLALTWGFVGSTVQHFADEPVVGTTAAALAVLVAAAGIWTGLRVWRRPTARSSAVTA